MAIDVKRELRAMLPHLKKAQEENLNEEDTILRIMKILEGTLGYDGLTEITREQQIREKYADIAVKIDGAVKFLIEAKGAGVTLRDRHIEQAQHYAAVGNIRWVILTNGIAWNLYHLSFDEGVEYERAFSIDLLVDPIDKASESLGLLHRQSVSRGELEDSWKRRAALSPESICKALFLEHILKLIRREIKKSKGILIDVEDLGSAIQALLSPETREQIGPFKMRRRKMARRSKRPKVAEAVPIQVSGQTVPLEPQQK